VGARFMMIELREGRRGIKRPGFEMGLGSVW
jgi:hypothetical protein